jgi:hypothetical protein
MRINLFVSLLALGALIALPAAADACPGGKHYSSHYNDRHAVAGYDASMRDDYMAMGNSPSYARTTAEVDAARIAEYNAIFGGSGYAVAGYSSTRFSPWMQGGTWATVNGQHIWVRPSDFTWSNNRWVWAESPTANIVFDDPHYDYNNRYWYTTTTWSPWTEGGTWVNVNGQRVWASEDDFVWMNDRWVWADDNDAVVSFDDDRFKIDAQDWGINDIKVDSERFDLDVDREKLDLDPDLF